MDGIGGRMPTKELALQAGSVVSGVENIADRVRAGDAAAFRELFELYQGLVYRLALRLLGNPEEAADLSQEVFVVVHRRIHTLRDGRCLKSWICRITVTRARNRLRLLRRRHASYHVSLDQAMDPDRSTALCTNAPDPERTLLGKESLQMVLRALERVPFPYRVAVIMRDIEAMSYDEIARSLGVGPGTVKSRIARGRNALRLELGEV
jgi:RNA polymerase sigma-70 factor (ECF subfamily)